MAAQPIVSFLNGSALSAPIGGAQTITLRFDNQPDAAPGSNVGYSPYITLVIPSNGADGAGVGSAGATTNDGISFLGATYLGLPVETFAPIEFNALGQAIHPFATDNAGNPLVITGTPGDTLLVLRLPFGSFTPDQTPADVQVQLGVSNLADLGKPLNLQAWGGFAYGRDEFVNPAADNPVVGPSAGLAVTPTVIALDKVYVGPEQETATGPSYPRSWLVEAHIANGQTVTNLVLTDRMPDGTFITGASILNGTGTVTFDNATGLVVATLTGPYTGGIGGVPTLKVDFYVPEFLRDGVTPVLDPVTGAFRVLENDARLDARWQPTDGRDPLEVFAIDPAGPEDIITAKSIAVQKSVSVVDALKAGGTLEWSLDGQVSNYFNMDDLVLTDTLGDGQVFDAGFTPTIVVREGGAVIFNGTLSPENVSVVRDPATGISTIRFDVSAELRKAGLDDVLNGSPGGVENQATVLVNFRSTIETSYISTSPAPSNEPLVDQGDPLENGVDFGGVVDETDVARSDDSGAGVTLPVSEVGKSIYAINGNTAFPTTRVQSGDQITFRLTLDMPLTGAHDVALTDFLPLPVLDLVGAPIFQNITGSAVPASGFAKWGPGASFVTSGDPSVVPTVAFDNLSNSIRFDFGDAVAPGNPASRIDLLFTVTVLDRDFGDGLLLTNQVTSTETNSFGTVFEDNAIVQFTLGEPELRISKGVIADSNPNAQPTLADVGPVAFTAPGSGGNRFTGTINSTNLATKPIDADLTGADAGDRVSFAIVVENTGSGPRGGFDLVIRDTLPPGFEIPAGGLNLRVTDGAGNSQAFTLLGGGLFDAAGGIELTDGPGAGAIGAYSATSGENIIVITYDLELVDDVPVFGADLTNTATIHNYAAVEAGIDRTDFTPVADLTDTATVRTQAPQVTKTVFSTSEAHTGNLAGQDALTDLTIGETVTYRITVTLPEGSMKAFRIEDFLPIAAGGGVLELTGASFIGVTGLGGGSIFDITPTITVADRDGINGNDKVTFDFGDVLNTSDTTGTAPASVTVEVSARVRDLAANQAGDVLRNTAVASAEDPDAPGGRTISSGHADVEIVAPNLDVVKTADRTSADAFDTIKYTITVENKGVPAAGNGGGDFTARAWDVNLKDLLTDVLADAAFSAGTLLVTGIAAGRITINPGDPVDVTLNFLDPGEKITVTFEVVVDHDADAGENLDNVATVVGSTMDDTGSPDDRIVTDTDDHRVTVAGPSISKAIFATSDGSTGVARHGGAITDLRIGEEVTYEIRVRLPEGDSPNLRITDTLEDLTTAGNGTLTFIPGSIEVISVGSKLQTFAGGALPAPTVAASNTGSTAGDDRFVLSFGDVRNTAVNTALDDEVIVLRIKAVVNDLPQNNDADRLTNTARVDTGTTGTPSTNATSTVDVDVVEPVLSIDKASTVVAGQPIDAGAVVSYTITIRHTAASDAPAYDLAITDLIPTGMALVPGTLSANFGSFGVAINAISWTAPEYPLGSGAIIITYQAVLLDSVTPAQVLANTARLTYDTNPADPVDPLNPTPAEDLASRSYNAQDMESRTVALTPTLDKSVIATGDANTGSAFVNAANPDAAPGETVTYRLTVTVGEGTQRLVVSDTLPTGITFESASVESIGGTITNSALALGAGPTSTAGGAYSFDFGTITNAGDNDRDAGDTITILVTGRVATTATAGSTLTNGATAETYAPGGGKPGLATASDDAKIDVVRPDLVIEKEAAPALGDAGNLVTYSVTLRHAPGSTSPAYNLSLSDILPPGVTLVPGSVNASVGAVSEAGGNVGWTLNQYLLSGAPVTISYQARLANNVVDGQSITNTAAITYSSAPVLGVSVTESDPATTGVDIVNSIVKTLEGTSLATTAGSFVGIGEEVSFLVTTTLGEGAQRILLRDVLPTGLDYVSSTLVSLGGVTGSALSTGAAGSFDAGTRTVAFNLGDIVNPGDNLSNAADQVVFRVVARVADISGNTASTVLDNSGRVTSSNPVNPFGLTPGGNSVTVSENEAVTVVRASLGGIAFRDTDGDGIRDPGETLRVPGITVTLLNSDGSATGRSTVTGGDGSYLFDGLVPGDYRVRFDESGGNERTLANIGGNDSIDSDASQATGVTAIYSLANGDNLRNVDAGFFQNASLGDRVWEDVNGNGLQDDGATGIVGATVRLLDGDGMLVTSTTTGADGFYQFAGLAPGDYSIEVLPPGFTATTRNVVGTEATDSDVNAAGRSDVFNLESGEAESRVDAGFWRGAKLGGTVFEDVDGDGRQEPGETGISGRVVELLDINGNPTGQTDITDTNGEYLFENLAPGTYSVRFVPSAAQPFTLANVGPGNELDSDADRISGRTEQVVLVSGGDDRSLDAGVYNPATLGDRVWEDVNGNGIQDEGATGIVGATVRLLDADGNVVNTTVTGADGFYQFTGLAPGDYAVRVSAPGYVPTLRDIGAEAADSDIDGTGTTATTNLISGEAENRLDAGLYRPGSIGDLVWDDADNDGVKDATEAGLGNITVRLLSADGLTVLDSTTTAPDGTYRFDELAPGQYRVEFVPPSTRAIAKKDEGLNDSLDSDADRVTGRTDILTLLSGQDRIDVDAGMVSLGDLTGRVWIDRDGDGVEENLELPREGVRVHLLNLDGTPTGRTEVTGPDGTYLFKEVIAGTYRVAFERPPGFNFTKADQGSDATDSDAVQLTGITGPVAVPPGEVTRDVDAGIYLPASIGNRVWHDRDADGVQDPGEPGLRQVTVELRDGSGNLVGSQLTDLNGNYRFTDLAPDSYSVTVVPPSGFEFSPRDAGPDNLDSDAAANGVMASVFLFSGDDRTDLDAGLFRRAAVGNYVWFDTDGDGAQDTEEVGARGVTVRLLDFNGNVVATTVTGVNGAYAFTNLIPGTYSVQFVAPPGTAFTTRDAVGDSWDSDADTLTGTSAPFTLTSGEFNRTVDAGLLRTATIGDFVWQDRDRDGVQDAEEPGLGGVIVRLRDQAGNVIAATVTDASGYYSFEGVRPGTYQVRFVTPAGHTQTTRDVGDDATDSDAGLNGLTALFTVGQGQVIRTIDAGYIPDFVHPCSTPTTFLTPNNDAFPGTEAPDHIDGLGGNDNIHGLRGDDCLRGNDGDDVINGHEGNDTIKGDRGNDNLHGNAGDDNIYGGDGNDTIEAGEGNDWAEGNDGNDAMQGEGGNDTLFGGRGNDTVEGNGGDDIVFGNAGGDRVAGHDGNDTVIGGADNGRARLDSNGQVVGVVIGDTVSGDGGADRFIWQKGDGVDLFLDFNPGEGDTLTIYGYGGFAAVGQLGGRPVLYIDQNSAIVFNNGYGAPTTAGPFPGITFVPGIDVAPGLPGERGPITGGVGHDSLAGGAGNDWIEGLHGADTLSGSAGADTLDGGFGNDVLIGGAGADLLDGGPGIDTASYAGATAAVSASLAAPAGNAGIAAGDIYVQIENLIGTWFDDSLAGDGNANYLAGRAGADTVSGGGGNDTIVGGAGGERLSGGSGADRFVYEALADSPNLGGDVITDFAWVQGDRVDLAAIDADAVAGGDQAFGFVGTAAFTGGGVGSVRYVHSGGSTLVQVDGGDGGGPETTIRLLGLHTLTAADFVL